MGVILEQGGGLRDALAEVDPEMLLVEGFDEALIGYSEGWHPTGERYAVAAYDYQLCIEVLMRQEMTYEEAIEYFEYNVSGAYVGPMTPAFVTRLTTGGVESQSPRGEVPS